MNTETRKLEIINNSMSDIRKIILICERLHDVSRLNEDTSLPDGIYLTVSRSVDDGGDDDDDEYDGADDGGANEDGTLVQAWSRVLKDDYGNDLCVGHLHVPDENVYPLAWHAGDVWVNPKLQRKGIASAMYRRMAQELGLPAAPSATQSPAGKALWGSGKIQK